MVKQDVLNILYAERQRLSDRYSKPGWNNWVLLGAILYCILYFLDFYRSSLFVVSNVLEIVGVMLFYIISYMLFSDYIVTIFRGFIEERLKLKTIKRSLKAVKVILFIAIALYLISCIIEIITSFFKFQIADFYLIMIIISWIILALVLAGISLTTIIDKMFLLLFRFIMLGNTILFTSYMLNNYYNNWNTVDIQFSIIIIVFVLTNIMLWYSNIRKDLSSIDSLIDDVIIFDNPNYNEVFEQLKVITINTSLDNLFTYKMKKISKMKTSINSKINSLSKVIDQMNADYFQKEEAKQIRENFFSFSRNILDLNKEYHDTLDKMLEELSGAINNIKSYRMKNRISSTILIINELVCDSKLQSKFLSNLIDKAEKKLPQCVLCENCSINCKDENKNNQIL